MGADVGVEEPPAPAAEQINAPPAPANDRQQTARTWLIAAAVIPFLIAIIGYGAYERPTGVNGPTGNLPTLASPTAGPSAAIRPLSLLSISRNGNSLTLIGDFPNEAAKATLMKSLRASSSSTRSASIPWCARLISPPQNPSSLPERRSPTSRSESSRTPSP